MCGDPFFIGGWADKDFINKIFYVSFFHPIILYGIVITVGMNGNNQ